MALGPAHVFKWIQRQCQPSIQLIADRHGAHGSLTLPGPRGQPAPTKHFLQTVETRLLPGHLRYLFVTMCEAPKMLRRFVFEDTTLHLVSQHRGVQSCTSQASVSSGRSNNLDVEATSAGALLLKSCKLSLGEAPTPVYRGKMATKLLRPCFHFPLTRLQGAAHGRFHASKFNLSRRRTYVTTCAADEVLRRCCFSLEKRRVVLKCLDSNAKFFCYTAVCPRTERSLYLWQKALS